VDATGGVRLLGVGVAGLTDVLQEDLFADDVVAASEPDPMEPATAETAEPETDRTWRPGADVEHDDHGPGWVWGSGLGRVTVRFETRETPPGPVRTFSVDDPALRPTG